MSEGGLEAPTRHALAWREPEFTDADKIDAELRRVFDICHGCRRCFNLCDSFPRLFDLIDNSDSGELDSVTSEGFGKHLYSLENGDLKKFLRDCTSLTLIHGQV